MALDWFTGLVGYDGSRLRVGHVLELSAEGEVRWQREKSVQVRGSFASSLLVGRASATSDMLVAAQKLGLQCATTSLWVSGNPAKYLQGHNAFGPSVMQLAPTIHSVVRSLPDGVRPPDAGDPGDLRGRAFHRSRVDIAVGVDLGSDTLVHEWIATAARSTRSRQGPAMLSGSTVYWGKNSRRWSIKAYCKFCELEDHRPAESFDELRDWTRGQLRIELTLRTPELKPRGTLDEEIVWEYWEKVVVGVTDREPVSMEQRISSYALPSGAKLLLNAWLHGARDPRDSVSRASWYRYRRMILEQVGVDVSLPPAKESPNIKRAGFDVAFLKSKWVRDVPSALQPLLFRPEHPLTKKWPAHP